MYNTRIIVLSYCDSIKLFSYGEICRIDFKCHSRSSNCEASQIENNSHTCIYFLITLFENDGGSATFHCTRVVMHE